MTVPTVQLVTRARTWVLVAGLTALLIGIGAALGGAFMWIFAIFAVGSNAVGYFYSDRIALRAARAEPLSPDRAPQLHAMALELADRAGIVTPRLFIMPGAQPNAFATGRDEHHAAVAVTEGLLAGLPPEQIRAVLAHEFAHIANHDILVSSIAAMIAGAISAVATMLQFSFLFGASDDEEGENPIAALAMMIVAPVGAMLLQLAVSRQREYLADATAARMLGSGRPLAQALATIAGRTDAPLNVNAATAPMYIANPLGSAGVAGLFATHPPMESRIQRLLGYDRSHDAPALRHRRNASAEGLT